MQQQSTAARVFNLVDVEEDIAAALKDRPPLRDPQPVDYAPPAVRAPMPGYVEHRDGVNEVGKLSAEAVVREYEAAASEVEAMGNELKGRIEKLEATKAEAVAALGEIKETAARYRDEGKRVFLQIEDCSLMTAEVRATCDALKLKIAGPSS
jgi:hypothetical protein